MSPGGYIYTSTGAHPHISLLSTPQPLHTLFSESPASHTRCRSGLHDRWPHRHLSYLIVLMKKGRRGPASRTKASCNVCKRRHERCDGRQPCHSCWKQGVECVYEPRALSVKAWKPAGDAALPSVEAGRSSCPEAPSSIAFVSENWHVESYYEVLQTMLSPHSVEDEALRHSSTSANPPQRASDLAKAHLPIADPVLAFFMERYCNIIGPWFDMFDTTRQWSHTVSHLALSNKSLLQSIIASCAKQHSLVYHESTVSALDYYNSALKELSAALGDPAVKESAAVFASCLLIGYCEMIDARSLDWHTHLSGTSTLCTTQGWHGSSGGVAQSCFWVYCRMDLLASIARSEHTLLPTSSWLGTGASVYSYDDGQTFEPDSWCNRVVLLLAETHNLLCDVGKSSYKPKLLHGPAISGRWNRMSSIVSIHESHRPATFYPVIELPPLSAASPFKRTIYVSPAAAAATQMLDLAELFLILAFSDLSHEARIARLSSRSITVKALDLSRRIIANSISNRHTIAWANAVQLLSTAGLCIVGCDERAALVQVLGDIKAETGWSTEGHVVGLKAWWSGVDGDLQHAGIELADESLSKVSICLLKMWELYPGQWRERKTD